MTTTTTQQALRTTAALLDQHPDLPQPLSVYLYPTGLVELQFSWGIDGDDDTLIAAVRQWADTLGVPVTVTGNYGTPPQRHVHALFTWQAVKFRALAYLNATPEPDDDRQECSRCRDRVHTLSSDGLCDGCVHETTAAVTS